MNISSPSGTFVLLLSDEVLHKRRSLGSDHVDVVLEVFALLVRVDHFHRVVPGFGVDQHLYLDIIFLLLPDCGDGKVPVASFEAELSHSDVGYRRVLFGNQVGDSLPFFKLLRVVLGILRIQGKRPEHDGVVSLFRKLVSLPHLLALLFLLLLTQLFAGDLFGDEVSEAARHDLRRIHLFMVGLVELSLALVHVRELTHQFRVKVVPHIVLKNLPRFGQVFEPLGEALLFVGLVDVVAGYREISTEINLGHSQRLRPLLTLFLHYPLLTFLHEHQEFVILLLFGEVSEMPVGVLDLVDLGYLCAEGGLILARVSLLGLLQNVGEDLVDDVGVSAVDGEFEGLILLVDLEQEGDLLDDGLLVADQEF